MPEDEAAAAADHAQDRDAWIAAAERDVRAERRPYQLVPLDAPVRVWDATLAGSVERSGRDLIKAARGAARRAQEKARETSDFTGEQRARYWEKELAAAVRAPRLATPSPDRWLTAAAMVGKALEEWLPDEALSEDLRRALAWLGEVREQRAAALDAAIAAALDDAISVELERRSAPQAWEEERERREREQEEARQAEAAREAVGLVSGSLLARLGAPEGYEVLVPYEMDRDGVWNVRTTDTGLSQRAGRIAYAPLVVTQVFADPDGEQLVELAWLDGPRCVRRAVPRSVAKSGKALVKMLGNVNLPVVEADGRNVERYLAAVEADNRLVIPRTEVARQLGWQPDGTFVSGQDAPRRVEPRYEQQRAPLSAFHPAGTLEEWKAAVKLVEPYPMVRLVLAAGLAAPLLEPLGVDSFTVDISGRTTRGKTTAASVAMSAWACPVDGSEGIASWRTTMYAAELQLNLRNGLPTVFDETRVVKEEGLVDAILYQVPKNRGAARGSRDNPFTLSWLTILISTGEQPALSFTTHEGASARILSLRGAPFGTDGQKSAADARAVTAALGENYGTAGPAFVERLREELAEPGGRERLQRRHAELMALHAEGGDVSRRRSASIAALRLAAELAYAWQVCPLPPLETGQWIELLSVEQQRDDRGAMALEIAREFVARQPHRMWERSGTDVPAGGWIGAYLETDRRRTVALLPEVLGEELARRGYRIDAVRQAWIDAKLITLEEGNLVRRYVPHPKRVRVYEFDRSLFDGEEPAAPQDTGPCAACGWPRGSNGHIEQCGPDSR